MYISKYFMLHTEPLSLLFLRVFVERHHGSGALCYVLTIEKRVDLTVPYASLSVVR